MTRVIVALVAVGAALGGCSALNKRLGLQDDNPVEEFLEQVIENKTGQDIDLTPESKEGDTQSGKGQGRRSVKAHRPAQGPAQGRTYVASPRSS